MRNRKIYIVISLFLATVAALFYWYHQMEDCSHFTPDYKKANLSVILQKKYLSKEDYNLLFYQTGLAPSAVDAILSKEDNPISTITDFQERFFYPADVNCRFNTVISKEEKITGAKAMLAPYEDADILITNASHVLFYRNGHAGLVIDAKMGQTLEAVVMGSNSSIQDISKWKSYPNFALLRLKHGNTVLTSHILETAKKSLCDIPYHLTSGLFGTAPVANSKFSGTHCSHLVWSAYYLNGINLDSDGGRIVTPHDILESSSLELVQIYGLNPSDYADALKAFSAASSSH